MSIGAILQRWLDVLATVLFACRELWRVRRTLIVSRDGAHVVVRRAEPHGDAIVRADGADRGKVIARVAAGARPPAALVRNARQSFVIYELPPDSVAVRTLSVPAKARAFLDGVVRNQIERLSPWPFD